MSWGHPQNVPKRHPQGDVLRTSTGRQFCASRTNAFLLHYFQFYFTKCVPETQKSQLFYGFRFLKKRSHPVGDVLGTSPRSQFEHKYKTHFCGKNFKFQFPKCVYQILKSQLLYILSVLEIRPMNVLKTSQSETCSVTSLSIK